MMWIGSQTTFLLWFQASHPKSRIKQCPLQKLKPYYVKPLKDKNICCCNMLKVSLNFLKDPKKGMHEKLRCDFHCNVYSSIGEFRDVMCSTPGKVYKGITQL
jgi:hypothetical protein